MYTITPPVSANVSIHFGPDATYGLNTWEQPSPPGGGAVTILVAGMKLNSTYHMRAILKFADSSEPTMPIKNSPPEPFLPPAFLMLLPRRVPVPHHQSGVELLDLVGIAEPSLGAAVTDLGGCPSCGRITLHCREVPKLTQLSCWQTGASWSVCRHNQTAQVRLFRKSTCPGKSFGNLTGTQLNQALAHGNLRWMQYYDPRDLYDFAVLPNGHLIVIASENVVETGLTGFPNPVTVAGDVLIDLDQNHNPVWLWSSFDHLDLNRHPLEFFQIGPTPTRLSTFSGR